MANSEAEQFRCEICGVALANQEGLVEHREGHAEKAAEGAPGGVTGPELHCAVCAKSFETAEQVKAHHHSAHGL